MSADPAIQAAYKRAFARLGVTVQVTFTRVTGFAPNPVTVQSATVSAKVMKYQPDTESVARSGYAATQRGAITEGDRYFIVMACDLAAAGYPLPVLKNDKVTMVETDDQLNVVAVDANERAAAGAIEIRASGTA